MLQWTRITKVTLNVQMISEYTSLFQYLIELFINQIKNVNDIKTENMMKYEIAYVETHCFHYFWTQCNNRYQKTLLIFNHYVNNSNFLRIYGLQVFCLTLQRFYVIYKESYTRCNYVM